MRYARREARHQRGHGGRPRLRGGHSGADLGQQKGTLDIAKGSLLRLPHVAFVHVLAPDGKVLTSSNEKYAVAGRADDRASWALQATDLQTRPGDLPGTIEIAAPFQGASGRGGRDGRWVRGAGGEVGGRRPRRSRLPPNLSREASPEVPDTTQHRAPPPPAARASKSTDPARHQPPAPARRSGPDSSKPR